MSGVGYGKVILFGEHFVVYGKPAIVAGLRNLKKRVEVKEGKWNKEFDAPTLRALARIAILCDCPERVQFNLKISGNVPMKQNLGSSAALCVAFARALDSKYTLNMDNDRINHVAYEGEKEFHGNPSGIDTSAATYGGLFVFKKDPDGTFKIMPIIKAEAPFHLLISSTGEKKLGTGAMVQLFKERMEKNPKYAEKAFNEYLSIYFNALEAITLNDMPALGALMDANHKILVKFGLSTPEIDRAISLMKESGSLGCKITGAGGGGNIIGLFKTKNDAEKSKDTLEKEGFPTLYTTVK